LFVITKYIEKLKNAPMHIYIQQYQ